MKDIKVEFADAGALNTFLFSKSQDILDSLLDNTVKVEGNVNFIFKFGFMARDLGHRLGVEDRRAAFDLVVYSREPDMLNVLYLAQTNETMIARLAAERGIR